MLCSKPLDFNAQFDGFIHAIYEAVEGRSLCMASGKTRNRGDIVALFVALDHNVERTTHIVYPRARLAAAGTAVGAGAGGGTAATSARVKPSALRNSTSSFLNTSGLSFRNCRAFSRPCPMRSPL